MQTSNDFHNLNCYRYLQQIKEKLGGEIFFPLLKTLWDKQEIKRFLAGYNENISYADLYHQFLSRLEQKINDGDISELAYDKLIDAIYANDNQNLAETFKYFQGKLSTRRLYELRPEALVSSELANTKSKVGHKHSPQAAGSILGRAIATVSSNFKPMLTTSIPTVRSYRYGRNNNLPTELRFGTQAQRHQGKVRLSPLFQHWIKQNQAPHVYFNLLGYDRFNYEGRKERDLSVALHAAEEIDKLYVITLPADKGLMDKNDYKKQAPKIKKQNAFEEMLAIAMGISQEKIKDFEVSQAVKAKLYPTKNEQAKLTELLNKSFAELGFTDDDELSPAAKQAVWFHFCKFEFPNFVLETLKPATWNASCKDAIDRGAVASAYYNLMKSFATVQPMSKEEFEQGLHAAAAMVKGRGLNHHYEIIWNAVNHYVTANYANLINTEKSWLIHWRNDNTPKIIAQDLDYVAKICDQSRDILTQSLVIQLKENAISIINEVKCLIVGEPRRINKQDLPLALELVAHTTQLALDPKHPKQDLPAMVEDLGKRPIFMNVLQRFKNWIKMLFSPKKHQSALGSNILQFKAQLESLQRNEEDNQENKPKP